MILNLKYDEIKTIINKRIEDFFKSYDEIHLNLNFNKDNQIYVQCSLNQIFKKILLENNRVSPNKVEKPTSVLVNPIDKISSFNKTRILMCSDALDESDILFDQKLLFLMKRQNIHLDCISIGKLIVR